MSFCSAAFAAILAIAQNSSMLTHPPAFDIVSIKPSRPEENMHMGFGKTGYSATGITLRMLVYEAYFGFNDGGRDAVNGGPDWANKDSWDIEAKVAPEDLAAYERERTDVDNPDPISRRMLQTMLADRFKLVVHRAPAQMPAFAIEVAKNGLKVTPAVPNEPQPSGSIPLLGGGFLTPYQHGTAARITYTAVSMSTFAHEARGMAGGPVIDRTNLAGKYDFTLTWLSLGPDEREGYIDMDDPFPLSHWNFGVLGLKVERIQIPTEHIAIDHVEKPSAN